MYTYVRTYIHVYKYSVVRIYNWCANAANVCKIALYVHVTHVLFRQTKFFVSLFLTPSNQRWSYVCTLYMYSTCTYILLCNKHNDTVLCKLHSIYTCTYTYMYMYSIYHVHVPVDLIGYLISVLQPALSGWSLGHVTWHPGHVTQSPVVASDSSVPVRGFAFPETVHCRQTFQINVL